MRCAFWATYGNVSRDQWGELMALERTERNMESRHGCGNEKALGYTEMRVPGQMRHEHSRPARLVARIWIAYGPRSVRKVEMVLVKWRL